jgi:molybdopterin-binding protein
VVLSREPVQGLSARNCLRGIVRERVDLPGHTFVAMDVSQFLWAEVTPEAVRELDIRPGEVFLCVIKTTAVEVVD